MKKGNVIKIIPTKRKPGINESKKKYFDKLSKNNILSLLSFFTGSEQLKFFIINNKFKAAFCQINSINQINHINQIKYLLQLNELRNQSKNFTPYSNVLLNMNTINLNEKYFGFNIGEKDKYNLIKIFLEKNYKEAKENKIQIQISKKEDFNTYYSVLNIINKEIREKFKYDIDISLSIDINESKDIILKLFNLISFKNIKPFNDKNKTKFIEIQNYFLENNIKTFHKYIWSQKQSIIECSKKYFSTYNNCLLGINNKKSLSFSENNKESLSIINISSFPIKEFDYQSLKLKKIKFSFASQDFNSVLLNYNNFSNLEEISGFVITRKNINKFIEKISSMENLKKISRIKFGGLVRPDSINTCERCGSNNIINDIQTGELVCSNCGCVYEGEEEDDETKYQLFEKFFTEIKKTHSNKLVSITTWFYVFRKGKDYEFILNNFPNIRRIQEDYDASGLYDQRIEINKIFSCNAEGAFKDNDLCAITKMVKNYIRQKNPGDNCIKFDLFNNFERLNQLFEYWNKNNEKEILEKIDYINFVVEAELNGNEKIQLNSINRINFINENICLAQLLKEVKNVNQIVVKNKNFLKNNLDFLKDKNVCSIVLDIKDLTSDEFENLKKLKNIKHFVLEDEPPAGPTPS